MAQMMFWVAISFSGPVDQRRWWLVQRRYTVKLFVVNLQ